MEHMECLYSILFTSNDRIWIFMKNLSNVLWNVSMFEHFHDDFVQGIQVDKDNNHKVRWYWDGVNPWIRKKHQKIKDLVVLVVMLSFWVAFHTFNKLHHGHGWLSPGCGSCCRRRPNAASCHSAERPATPLRAEALKMLRGRGSSYQALFASGND